MTNKSFNTHSQAHTQTHIKHTLHLLQASFQSDATDLRSFGNPSSVSFGYFTVNTVLHILTSFTQQCLEGVTGQDGWLTLISLKPPQPSSNFPEVFFFFFSPKVLWWEICVWCSAKILDLKVWTVLNMWKWQEQTSRCHYLTDLHKHLISKWEHMDALGAQMLLQIKTTFPINHISYKSSCHQ